MYMYKRILIFLCYLSVLDVVFGLTTLCISKDLVVWFKVWLYSVIHSLAWFLESLGLVIVALLLRFKSIFMYHVNMFRYHRNWTLVKWIL